jgi:predicted component of type VI protein secretion system
LPIAISPKIRYNQLIHNSQFTIHHSQFEEASVSEKNYQLVMQQGPKPGQRFDLIGNTVTLGRDALADIIIVDPEVSRQHVQFTATDTGYRLKDLGSTNGTFVNGRRLTDESVDLEPGQEIKLGGTIVLRYEETSEVFIPPLVVDDLPESADDQEAAGTEPAEAAAADEQSDEATVVSFYPSTDIEGQAETDADEDEEWVLPAAATDDLEAIFGETADSDPDLVEDERDEVDVETADLDPSPPPPAPVFTPSYTPPAAPPPAAPAAAADEARHNRPLVPPGSGQQRRSRRTRTVLVATLLLLLCCCAFLVFMYYRGGDLLLEYLGLI